MDVLELEGLAAALYDELDIDPAAPPGTYEIARRWLDRSVLEVRNMVGPPAKTFDHGRRIAVRASVPLEYRQFFVGHELGHLLLRRIDYVGEDEEACADYLGAALMIPARAVVAAHREFGLDPRELADRIVCTQTAAALRFGEVLAVPLAAVSPAVVRVRGPEWVWGDEATIRRMAARPGPGVRKIRITDGKGRAALVAEEG